MITPAKISEAEADSRFVTTTSGAAQGTPGSSVRTYYLGDMLFAADQERLGPVFSKIQLYRTVSMLIQTIVDSIEPDSWQVNNPDAKGTIVFNPITLSITVKQTAEIHHMLGGLGR